MNAPRAVPSPHFGPTAPPSMVPARDAGRAGSEDELPGFTRLWTAFMSARVLIAAAILGIHGAMHIWTRPLPRWLVAACVTYLVLAIMVRTLARPRGPGRSFDRQWFFTAGVDLAFFVALQSQQVGTVNYTPLLAMPVLMSAVLGSRALALGTAALVTLALLGQAAWSADLEHWSSTSDMVQAGLAGAGLLVLALLTNQLAIRLAREEGSARRSRIEAQVQSLVNGMVIDAMDDGVLVVDPAYLVRSANPAARLMLGSDQDVTPDQFSLDDNPAWRQLADIVRLTFETDPTDGIEVTLHYEDRHSSRLQVRTQRTPTVDDSGRCLCVMFLQDLREMEAQLRTEKLAGMGRMSAAVAHEIRNPLAAISQANALLEEDLTAPGQLRLTAMVRQNADRLGHIVDDILDVVRVQGQSEPFTADALELDAHVDGFCGEWSGQHNTGSRLALQLGMPDGQVQFSPEHLRRILVNLLDNAARYATRRAGAIQVTTLAVRHGPAMLMVWSDGPPLEPSVRRHLFEPFFSSESRSSGLGLFICRELCERHGASMGYERTERAQDGVLVAGNEFFVSFRRAHGHYATTVLDASA
ncbi:MAG: PAS domain-containing protein [Ottowia sp.]|nr:PAS domain-containing protein [Ottowia sp.]